MKASRMRSTCCKASIVASSLAVFLQFSTTPSFSLQPKNNKRLLRPAAAFVSCPTTTAAQRIAAAAASDRRTRATTQLYSSTGGGNLPPPNDGEGQGEWGEFLDPSRSESDNLRRAREYMSENSLPISFDHVEDDEGEGDDVGDHSNVNGTSDQAVAEEETDVSSSDIVVGPRSTGDLLTGGGDLSKEALERNPYMAVVSGLSPSELISRFTATSHPRVQTAVRTTILGLIGGLPKMAFDTKTYSTGQRLASLMFQLQMTGYMFKNAEYRLSLESVIKDPASGKHFLLSGSDDDEDVEDDDTAELLKGKVRGKLRIRVPSIGSPDGKEEDADSKGTNSSSPSSDDEVEVDAAAYMSELRTEVSMLRDELVVTRREKEEALRKDLLLYIRTLPEKELRSLTNTMSQDVLVAMKGLVNAVMSGVGEGQIGPDTITEQSGEALAQLCMWQLAIGYNLRTLEVREEMKKSLTGGIGGTDDTATGVDHSAEGFD